jgi:GH15 family glucan-1,4-alpha-glucosidase
MPAAAAAVYRRALVTMEQSVNDVGGIIAAPTNLNPPYRFVWPRDGSFIARCLQSVGFDADARRCFEFQERLQRPDGGWAVNYFPDGSRPLWEFGAKGDEHDEVGTFVWGVDETFRADGDTSWLAARWPAVQKACDFLLRQQQANGLLTTCRDLWELDSDGSWTYSNGAAWAGLQAGARIAQQLGHDAESERYLAAASRLKAAIEQNLVFEGVLVRGARGGGVDRTLEAANLALGSNTFGVWSDSDPRLKQTADAVGRKLISPWGGIRRYEGDRYYDGQPWPVSTAWLGMVRLAEGDRAGAQALFDTMTRYAQQTDALMLGEQFDEANKRWVSAFPLNWSEAVYVQFAQQLYGN